MLLADLVRTSATVAASRSRLTKTAAVAESLRAAAPADIEVVAWYLAGHLPQRRTGVGWRSLSTLPEPATQESVSVSDVDAVMTELESLSGAGVVAGRAALITDLFGRMTAEEQEFTRALMLGNLRQGASDGVLLAAIAAAAEVPETAVRRGVMLAGFAAPVARIALSTGESGLAGIRLEPGRPLRPMLAGSAPEVAAALAGKESDVEVAVDRKLDGIRLQVHKVGNEISLFTRSLDDITDRLPQIVEFARSLPAEVAVLDAEAISLRPDGRPEAFQDTASRAMPLSVFAFDALHVDGDDLVDLPLADRLARLDRLVPAEHRAARLVTKDVAAAQEFFAAQIAAGHEGVIVKSLSAPYAAGRRGAGWVKVKPRHTLDLVVLAVEWGSGRRRGKLSNIHLGARDDRPGAQQEFVMLGKTFKGMTDEMLDWQTARFTELATHSEGHVVYLRPEQVVEIALDGVQRSRRYPGGAALRFARVLRYRDDKPLSEIDALSTVLGLDHATAPARANSD